jgi:pimeloyl-ACP methyl ester carboxylesterase
MDHLKEDLGVSDTVLAKVLELEILIEHENLTDVDLVGHSQGGLISAVLSVHRPELVKNLVLQSPEGFQGELSTPKLVGKMAYEVMLQTADHFKELTKGNSHNLSASMTRNKSFTGEFFRDVIWRLTEEVPGSAKVDLVPILEQIMSERRETGIGPMVTLVNAQNDSLFNPEMHEEKLQASPEASSVLDENEGPFKYIDSWAMYSRKGAGHNAAAIELSGLIRQVLAEAE